MNLRSGVAFVAMGLTIAITSFASLANAGAVRSTFRDCRNICPELVVVAPGSFRMGEPKEARLPEYLAQSDLIVWEREKPGHLVSIGHEFALGKYDVTRREFAAFVEETGYQVHNACLGAGQTGMLEKPEFNWRSPGFVQTDRDPVVCVSQTDAQAYVSWLSRKTGHVYRLPTEAEWEYAARAGTSAVAYWGDDLNKACRYANVFDITNAKALRFDKDALFFHCIDGYVYTSPVGSFLPNRFGIYDMLGNVSQWTEDCWHGTYDGAPVDGSAWISGDCRFHVVRGGSWGDGVGNNRSTARQAADPDHTAYVGFRVARTL
jgi:formylglycine-generating enzyme required for sulfatase activity